MMVFKLELVAVSVSDVDRAKFFFSDKAGFEADHDHTVSDEIRFVQLTPPGSACSIAIGKGVVDSQPGGRVPDTELLGDGMRPKGRRYSSTKRCVCRGSPLLGVTLLLATWRTACGT